MAAADITFQAQDVTEQLLASFDEAQLLHEEGLRAEEHMLRLEVRDALDVCQMRRAQDALVQGELDGEVTEALSNIERLSCLLVEEGRGLRELEQDEEAAAWQAQHEAAVLTALREEGRGLRELEQDEEAAA